MATEVTESPESGVDAVGSVCGRHDDDVRPLLEPVHQGEQLRHDAPLHLSVSLRGADIHLHFIHSSVSFTGTMQGNSLSVNAQS